MSAGSGRTLQNWWAQRIVPLAILAPFERTLELKIHGLAVRKGVDDRDLLAVLG
jgi:hypothetical protein